MSYLQVIKQVRVDPKANSAVELEDTDLDKMMFPNMPKQDAQSTHSPSREAMFVDVFLERLYKCYSDTRQFLHDNTVPHRTDHSAYLDVIMKSIHISEKEIGTDEDVPDHEDFS